MAKKGKLKIKFLKDYSPRKKDEVKELDRKLAEFYLNNGIAELTDTTPNEKGGCEDCNKAEKVAKELATANESLAKANETIEAKTGELTTANERITELEALVKTKDSELATANESLAKANDDLKSAQDQLKTSEDTLKKANAEVKKLKK